MTPTRPNPVPADSPPTGPLIRDAACGGCGYNLRGLAGDPVRCPECFREHPRETLEPSAARIGGIRELQAAADALMLGILVAAFGLILAPCGGLLLVIYAVILIGPAMSEMKQRFRGQAGWAALLWQFVGLTIAVPVCFLALTIGLAAFGGAIARSIGAGEVLILAAAATGLAIGTIVLVRVPITARLRRRQAATFEQLCRMLPPIGDSPSAPPLAAEQTHTSGPGY